MLLEIKKELKSKEEELEEEEKKIMCKIRIEKEKCRIIGIYIQGDWERKSEGLKSWKKKEEKQ